MSRLALLLALIALTTNTATAQTTYNWNNAAGGLWSTGSNWTPAGPPNATSHIARLNLGAAYNLDVDSNFTVAALQFGSGQTGAVNVRGVGTTPPQQLTLVPGTGSNGSIPSFDGRTTIFLETGAGSVTHTIGPITGSNNAPSVFLGGGSAGNPVHHVWEIQANRTLVVSSQILATSASNNTLTKVGAGRLVLSNANNFGNPAWTGGLIVANGVAELNGTVSAAGFGPLTVQGNATVTGRGNVSLSGTSTATINTAGIVQPGTAAATPTLTVSGGFGLNMQAGSILNLRLFGTGTTEMSRLAVNGDAVINTNQMRLDLSALNASQAQAMRDTVGIGNTRTYRVLTATNFLSGSGFNAGGFTVTDIGQFNPGEWTFGAFDTSGDNDFAGFVTVNFTPTPEPSAILALTAVAGAVAGGIRRRWKKSRPSVTG